jgi:hypothetical protein
MVDGEASGGARAGKRLVARRFERGSLLITTNQVVTQWATVLGDDVLAAAILDLLLRWNGSVSTSPGSSNMGVHGRSAGANNGAGLWKRA